MARRCSANAVAPPIRTSAHLAPARAVRPSGGAAPRAPPATPAAPARGRARASRAASSRAARSRSVSRSRFATRNGGSPAWRVPRKSPGPRSCRSASAITKPSVERSSTRRRWNASWDTQSGTTRMQCPGRLAAADAAAQLVELRQAEALRVLDDDHRRVRHVDADLDHGGRHQHVELAGLEAAHDGVLLVGLHPAVDEVEAQAGERAGRELAHHGRGGTEIASSPTPRPAGRRRRPDGRPRPPPAGGRPCARAAPRGRSWSRSACGPAAARRAWTRRGRRRASGRACAGSASRSSPARRPPPGDRRGAAAPRAAGRRSGAARRRWRGRGARSPRPPG